MFGNFIAGAHACFQLPDCITNCADLTLGNECYDIFCPFPRCPKIGYCDTTCGFCSVVPETTTKTTTLPITTTTTTTTTIPCEVSVNLKPDHWCLAANQGCVQCIPPSPNLCDALFCPTCSMAGLCDKECGICSTTTYTSTSTRTTRTKTTTSKTVTVTTITKTTTTSSTTTTAKCYDQDLGRTDKFGKGCAVYSPSMCALDTDTEDFDASGMCCACGGGLACQNSNEDGATDQKSRTCTSYTFDMCTGDADDDDFEAKTMCCVCQGLRLIETTEEDTTTAEPTVTLPKVFPSPIGTSDSKFIAGFIPVKLWWIGLIMIALCVLPLLLFLSWMACFSPQESSKSIDRPVEKDPDCVVVPEQNDCFEVNLGQDRNFSLTSVDVNGQLVTSQSEFENHFESTRDFAVESETSEREHTLILPRSQDAVSEATSASAYATTCDLFRQVDCNNDEFTADVDCREGCAGASNRRSGTVTLKSGDLLKMLAGDWMQQGRSHFWANIRDGIVSINAKSRVVQAKLHALQKGGVSMFVDGEKHKAIVVGDRILWENGTTWTRAGTMIGSVSAGKGRLPRIEERDGADTWATSTERSNETTTATFGARGFADEIATRPLPVPGERPFKTQSVDNVRGSGVNLREGIVPVVNLREGIVPSETRTQGLPNTLHMRVPPPP